MYNSVLKMVSQVAEARKNLKALNLFPHYDPYKSWDTYKMIEIMKEMDKNSYILDIGCNVSPILPMLKKLGFSNLYGCDLLLKPRYNHYWLNIAYSFFRRGYKPILDMYRARGLGAGAQAGKHGRAGRALKRDRRAGHGGPQGA